MVNYDCLISELPRPFLQVLAFTRAGDGVASAIVGCTTEETVPDAPERVKSLVYGESSAIISWLPPRRPNGVITKYTVYIRILDKGQELKIVKVRNAGRTRCDEKDTPNYSCAEFGKWLKYICTVSFFEMTPESGYIFNNFIF